MKSLAIFVLLIALGSCGRLGTLANYCLNCVLEEEGIFLLTYNGECWTEDVAIYHTYWDDWIECTDLYTSESLGYSCSTLGIQLLPGESVGNFSETVEANTFCYLPCFNSNYDIDVTDISADGVPANYTLTTLDDVLRAFWNDDYSTSTLDSSAGLVEKMEGDSWTQDAGEQASFYVVNVGTESGTFLLDAENAKALFAGFVAFFSALYVLL